MSSSAAGSDREPLLQPRGSVDDRRTTGRRSTPLHPSRVGVDLTASSRTLRATLESSGRTRQLWRWNRESKVSSSWYCHTIGRGAQDQDSLWRAGVLIELRSIPLHGVPMAIVAASVIWRRGCVSPSWTYTSFSSATLAIGRIGEASGPKRIFDFPMDAAASASRTPTRVQLVHKSRAIPTHFCLCSSSSSLITLDCLQSTRRTLVKNTSI